MSHDPNAQFDQSVLEMIEHSPIGAVPHTTSYVDALARLHASHQVYPSADHKGGHVTARSLASRPLFHAENLDALIGGRIEPAALEANSRIFDRYVQSLPAADRPRAEALRIRATGRPVHHRRHHGAEAPAGQHDPIHSLFLVPGTGLHHGLPGNYLHGSLSESGTAAGWSIHIHDSDDGVSHIEFPALAEALAKLQEVLASAPFHLAELDALGFRAK